MRLAGALLEEQLLVALEPKRPRGGFAGGASKREPFAGDRVRSRFANADQEHADPGFVGAVATEREPHRSGAQLACARTRPGAWKPRVGHARARVEARRRSRARNAAADQQREGDVSQELELSPQLAIPWIRPSPDVRAQRQQGWPEARAVARCNAGLRDRSASGGRTITARATREIRSAVPDRHTSAPESSRLPGRRSARA